jgi:hypothetical protein
MSTLLQILGLADTIECRGNGYRLIRLAALASSLEMPEEAIALVERAYAAFDEAAYRARWVGQAPLNPMR